MLHIGGEYMQNPKKVPVKQSAETNRLSIWIILGDLFEMYMELNLGHRYKLRKGGVASQRGALPHGAQEAQWK